MYFGAWVCHEKVVQSIMEAVVIEMKAGQEPQVLFTLARSEKLYDLSVHVIGQYPLSLKNQVKMSKN